MKYIALSDTHLGQNGLDGSGQLSLLSSDNSAADKKIESLATVISEFAGGSPISLIGVGDILDLCLSYMKDTLMEFNKLLDRLPKFHSIIYVIGNHDHHLWTMHSEYNTSIRWLLDGKMPNEGSIYRSTDLLGERFELLEKLFNGPSITITYPMFKLPETSIYFTHGHLFGGLYTFISDVLTPFISPDIPHINRASTLNVAVIEFIYWLIGETGEGMGSDGVMEAIYMDSQKGKKSLLYKALDSAVKVLLPDGIVKGFPNAWERSIARWVGRNMINQYVKEPRPITSIDRHMPSEESRDKALKWIDNTIQEEKFKLVFGHTHVADQFAVPDKDVEIFNLGSWLIDAKEPDPDTNVLLIDGDKLELKKI